MPFTLQNIPQADLFHLFDHIISEIHKIREDMVRMENTLGVGEMSEEVLGLCAWSQTPCPPPYKFDPMKTIGKYE